MLLEYRVQSKKEFLTSPFFPFPLFYLAAIICNRSSCGWCRRGIWRWGGGRLVSVCGSESVTAC